MDRNEFDFSGFRISNPSFTSMTDEDELFRPTIHPLALLLSIAAINVWNRLNAATKQVAGKWQA